MRRVSLEDLDACFISRVEGRVWRYTPPGTSLEKVHGVKFLCPLCFLRNGGPVGTHIVICWFAGRGVPDDASPTGGRWNPQGTGLHDLTFVGPGQTSVHLNGAGACGWHGYITGGHAQVPEVG